MRGPLNRLAGSGLASEGFIVLVGPHETGRSGFTAYWGCPEGDECPGNRRRRDGFCGLLASGEFYHRATEGNHARRTPQWLKAGAESFSWRAPGHTLARSGTVRSTASLGNTRVGKRIAGSHGAHGSRRRCFARRVSGRHPVNLTSLRRCSQHRLPFSRGGR